MSHNNNNNNVINVIIISKLLVTYLSTIVSKLPNLLHRLLRLSKHYIRSALVERKYK